MSTRQSPRAHDPYQERMTALFRISERRRRKYKQMVEDAQKDAATDASSTNTVSSSNTLTNVGATAAAAAEDPFPCLLGGGEEQVGSEAPSTAHLSKDNVKTMPKPTSARPVGGKSPGDASATRPRRPRRWNRHLSRGEGAVVVDKACASDKDVNEKSSKAGSTIDKRMPGITWDETWFVRGGDGGGGGTGFDAADEEVVGTAAAKPRTVASAARTSSILGRVEPREYDNDEVEDGKSSRLEEGSAAQASQRGAGSSTVSVSSLRHRFFCDGGNAPDTVATEKVAAPRRDRAAPTSDAAASMKWEDSIGAILSGGSWIDVTSTVASQGGIGEGHNEAPASEVSSSACVLVEEHSRNQDEEQIEVYYEAAESDANIVGEVAIPSAMDSNKVSIDSTLPPASPARLMRQVDRITGDLVEIQIDNSERCSPLRCVSSKIQRSPTSVRDPLTGDWVEIQPTIDAEDAHNLPGREQSAVNDRSEECESVGRSRSSNSSSTYSSSLSSSRVDESWSTVHDYDDRAEEDGGDLPNLSGYTDDTLVQDHASISPGGIAACGFGEGFCVSAATASATEDADEAKIPVAEVESSPADSSTKQTAKQDPAGFTVAEFLSLESSHAKAPKAGRVDESTCGEDENSSSDEEGDSSDDDDDDEIVRDGNDEANGQLLHGPSANEGIMAQYLCCGQDQAMLMEDSYDVDDEYEGDSLAESH